MMACWHEDWRLPLVLLALSLLWASIQIAADLGHEAITTSRRGLPIETRAGESAAPPGSACWPDRERLGADLPELIGLGAHSRLPVCEGVAAPVVIETWGDGRIVWFPGERLLVETW